jgi:hypothetical protein
MTHSFGTVARAFGAGVGVLLVMLFLADIAARLSANPSATTSAASRTAAARR